MLPCSLIHHWTLDTPLNRTANLLDLAERNVREWFARFRDTCKGPFTYDFCKMFRFFATWDSRNSLCLSMLCCWVTPSS